MRAVHLDVMELEGDRQSYLEPMLAISAPCEEGIGVDTAVLVNDAVEFRPGHCGCAYNHCFIVQDVLTGLSDGLCQMQVVGVERLQIVADGNVAEAESALYVIHYHVDGHTVISVQLPVLRQHVELLDP